MSKFTGNAYYTDVDALAKRLSIESPERVKEIKNLGRHPTKDKQAPISNINIGKSY